MTDVAHTLSEFIAAWNAGERPRLADYLERVHPPERDELADQIETFLMLAPEPEYSESAWAEMTAAPMVAEVAAASMAAAPEPLTTLRERAGLSLAQLAERLGFSGSKQEKAARYLGEVEGGEREPSHPLLARLGEILGGRPEWASAPAPAFGLPRAMPQSENVDRMDMLAEALLSDDEEWDEVDDLFSGGR